LAKQRRQEAKRECRDVDTGVPAITQPYGFYIATRERASGINAQQLMQFIQLIHVRFPTKHTG